MTLIDHPVAQSVEAGLVPGVDVVLRSSRTDVDALLSTTTLKLVGALHRRFWSKRREMLQNHALSMCSTPPSSTTAKPSDDAATTIADLRADDTMSWDQRLAEFGAIASSLADTDLEARGTVRVRNWSDTEAAVLVDGRAVPGCVFDIAVATSLSVESYRSGIAPLVISIESPLDLTEERLWADLVSLAEDRLGIERGVVRVVVEDPDTNETLIADVA